MIWLASYPRSGNTYFRVILDVIYGIRSSAYKDIYAMLLHNRKNKTHIVKTHQRPNYIFPKSKRIPAIYLVRDSRDAMVSCAHHIKDFKDPESEFSSNLYKLIVASNGNLIDRWNFHYYNNWSTHVDEWTKRANIVIRYEDLIINSADPQLAQSP